MPEARPKPCAQPSCKALVKGGYRGLCPDHAPALQLVERKKDQERGGSTKRGYDYRWQKARKTYLSRNPLCAHCSTDDAPVLATDVDHIIPHRIGEALDSKDLDGIRAAQNLFWDTENWQGLCHRCHSIKTAKEDGGFGRATMRRSA